MPFIVRRLHYGTRRVPRGEQAGILGTDEHAASGMGVSVMGGHDPRPAAHIQPGLLAVIPVFGAATAIGSDWPTWLIWLLVLFALVCIAGEFLRWWVSRRR